MLPSTGRGHELNTWASSKVGNGIDEYGKGGDGGVRIAPDAKAMRRKREREGESGLLNPGKQGLAQKESATRKAVLYDKISMTTE